VTFTVKIALQPFEVAFEAGSIAEAVAILSEPDNALASLAALAVGGSTDTDEAEQPETSTGAETPTKGRRGRKPKNPPVEAQAPAPIPVPDAAPPAPVDTTPNANGIPAFLDRAAAPSPAPAPAAAAATLAPPPPPAPAAPVTPPVGTLAPKVVAELKRRAEGSADGGQGLADWLAGAGVIVKGASFQEAVDCVAFLDDAKLGPIAGALQIG
jgi:hypothetical protein